MNTMSTSVFCTTNPLDNSPLATYPVESWEDVEQKIGGANQAFDLWKVQSFESRAALFLNAAQILKERAADYGITITQEMGKPLTQSIAEIEKCALVCEYYATNTAAFLAPQFIDTEFKETYVSYEPLGTVLQIMPWNFPFWQVFRFAAPALMAGNVTLLKHAPNVLGCVELIQQVFDDAGFPTGVFQNLSIEVDLVEKIMQKASVQGVALTGSVRAGKAVGALAGASIKNCVLELGGSDAFIVLADADLEAAAEIAVRSRMHNSGQTCISAKRFIVEQSVAANFKDLVKEKMKALVVGDPMDAITRISVMARKDLVETLAAQVQQSIEMGAHVDVKGGQQGDSNYFHPMLLSNIQKGMPAYDQELFGPVATFFEVANVEEAIALANDTVFGLAASIWSEDLDKAKKVATQLQVGAVAINRMMSSDPRIPFGGTKMSGIGRELGREGLLSFVNMKSVVVG